MTRCVEFIMKILIISSRRIHKVHADEGLSFADRG